MPPMMKLAIIGGGPSGFYVASRLLSLIGPESQVGIHIFDRLWAPHGLVRYGVAPDHPEVKNCTHKFDITATDPRFRFFGNVNIGNAPPPSLPHTHTLPLSSLFSNYTHIVFATGCTIPTLHPALPPSQYCIPALSLVHWYTQHPSNPPPPKLHNLSHISIIGNGNVSLDIARILLSPISSLKKLDIPQHVLTTLEHSSIKHISIIARRGPLQAAFTIKELRELINLPNASMIPIPPALLDNNNNNTQPTRQQSRILQLLKSGSKNLPGSTPKTWSLDFFRSPISLAPPDPNQTSSTPMAQLTLAHTTLDQSQSRALPIGLTSTLPTSLVVTSLGFQAEPFSASTPFPFLPSQTQKQFSTSKGGRVIPKVYASGWASTGAKGVLASTMMDAYHVADAILEDWRGSPAITTTATETETTDNTITHANPHLNTNPNPHPTDPPPEITQGIQAGLVTQYEDWKAVDREEVRRGLELGKERERMEWIGVRGFLWGKRSEEA